jgi:ribosomal protein L28
LLKSKEKRLKMSNMAIRIIDGKGSDRVARCMAFGEC